MSKRQRTDDGKHKAPGTQPSLKHHQRFDYVPINERRGYDWPNEARLAVYIAVNLEHFEFGKGLGAKLAPSSEPDVLNYSWREYGNRVGAWRLLDALKDLDIPVSLLVNSEIYSHCPELPAEYCKQLKRCEIVGHGQSNACKQSDMIERDEAQYIQQATATLEQHTGKAPKGWLSPWISESHVTLDLLQEQGYSYTLDWCHDDQPMWMKTRSGKRILSVPYSQEINDLPSIIARHDSASCFADMIIDQFEEMLEQSQKGYEPLVLGIALHPYIIGQPFRLRHLKRALKHIATKSKEYIPYSYGNELDGYPEVGREYKVWLTTAGKIAQYVEEWVEDCGRRNTMPGDTDDGDDTPAPDDGDDTLAS